MTTTWKPDGYNSVSPYLVTEKAQEIIDFLISSVGVAPLRRFENEDGAIMHAEVRLDDTVIMMGGPPEGFSAVLCHPLGSMYTCPTWTRRMPRHWREGVSRSRPRSSRVTRTDRAG